MSVVCSVDYSIARGYVGKQLTAQVDHKKHQVFLKLTCSENDLEDSLSLAKGSPNIVMVEYQGQLDSDAFRGINTRGIYVGVVKDAGADIDESDIDKLLEDIPDGVTLIIRLPKGYCDLGKLWELSNRYSNVRFCGGLLFEVDGVKIGMVGPDVLDAFKGKHDETSYMIDGLDDCVPDLDIFDLDINISVASSTSKSGSSKSSGSKASVKKKPVVSFASLMADSEAILP